jgi:hypothetical protein
MSLIHILSDVAAVRPADLAALPEIEAAGQASTWTTNILILK